MRLLVLLVTASCGKATPSRPAVHLKPAPVVDTPTPAVATTVSEPGQTEVVTPAPTLPAGIVPGELTSVPIPGYRAATVVHGRATTNLAMIYLHGICGQVSRIADWAQAASEFATTIAPMGNKPCPDSSSRFSWNQDIELIHQLIDKAVLAVEKTRDGLLDPTKLLVFGYSQGASRAERLVERYPERYRWVILGGPPRSPDFERLRGVLGLALLVGTEEHQEHFGDLARDFTARGVRTHFDQFEGVGHGFFGSSAPVVMRRTLTWLDLPIAHTATR